MAKLSRAERAILINQFKILAAIENEPNAYEQTIEVLSNGYESEYDEFLDGLGDPLKHSDCKYVQDILWLYYLMKLSRNREVIADPGGNRDASGMLLMENLEPKFPGFDGNNETRLLTFANFLIHTRDAFSEHKHHLNSHGGEPDYRAMLATWEGWGKPHELSEEQVTELLEIG